MGEMVIAAYRPHEGKEAALLDVIRDHVPILRTRGLATDREPLVMRAADGTILEIFEWVSREATDRAHHDEVVMELWNRFGAVSDFVPLATVEGTSQPFPHFEPIDL